MRGHIKQRSPGSWSIVLNLGKDPNTGKRIQKWVTVRGTRKEAEKELRRLLKPLDEGRRVLPSKATVAEYLRAWLDIVESELKSPATVTRYRGLVENNIVPEIGDVEIQKLEPFQIQQFYAHLLASGRQDGRGGLSPQTVRHVHALLRNALRRAVQFDKLASCPIDRGKVKPPAAPE